MQCNMLLCGAFHLFIFKTCTKGRTPNRRETSYLFDKEGWEEKRKGVKEGRKRKGVLLSSLFLCKTLTKSNLGVYIQVTVYHWWNSEQELKQEIEFETMEVFWRLAYYLANTFLIQPRSTRLGIVPPAAEWALLHQSSVKTTPQRQGLI